MFTYFLVFTLFMAIPISVMVLYVGLGIQGQYVGFRRLLPSACVLGIVLSIFRLLPIPFGLHSLVYLLMQIVALRYLSQGRWSMAVLGGLLTMVVSAVGEGLVTMPVMALLGISINSVLLSPWMAVAAGWLGNSLIVVLVLYFAIGRLLKNREAAE